MNCKIFCFEKNTCLLPKVLRVSILFLIILYAQSSFAQNPKISGSVYDSETNQPVEYASISVRNMPIGTITNAYGDFILNMPDSMAKGRLEISSIGYKSCTFPIDSVIRIEKIVIKLSPIDYILEEVVVVPGINDVQTILKNVVSKMNNNYSGKKYFLEAFFRHRVFNQKKSDQTVRLTEAAISIHQDHTSEDSKRVKINEIRNSENYADMNTSLGQKLFYKVLGGDQNPIYSLLMVERLTQKQYLKKLIDSEHYTPSLTGVDSFDGELVYIMDFKQTSWKFMHKKYYNSHTYKLKRYYINSKDFAILKAENISVSHNSEYKPFLRNDSIQSHWFIQYRKFDDKYYPSYVYLLGGIPDMVSKFDEEHFYNHEAEMMVNEIAVRRKDYDRIKSRNLTKKDKTLWDMDYEYNPTFWKNYNILLDYPLNQQFKKDLEFEKPLEEQFKKR
ncbi:MAG: carboxypeptidase-like regulatory domain-containing protein [Prolixibacteraceae bacterium]|nr:carboxypeptidase-like regulatory domain-containing protein [Prolixibacteraceae bacterium]